MLKHTLLLIYRNIKRFKSSFLINLIGLSVGLACATLIFLWVNDELQVDAFHENNERLYQIMENQQLANRIVTQEFTPDLLAETMAREIPKVEYAAAVTPSSWFGKFTLSTPSENIKAMGQFAGSDFFNLFSYNLIYGDKSQVLADKQSIVISTTLASRLFDSPQQAIGQTLRWKMRDFDKQVTITGVFEDVPANSTEEFDFVLTFEIFKEMSKTTGRPINWDNHGPSTYIVLQEGVHIDQFNKDIENFIKQKIETSNVTLFAQSYSDRYLYGNFENGIQAGGRIEYVRLFSIIALFIVIIACINFMNLATAKASQRLKEVGVKKAIGAGREKLIIQFLVESVAITLCSMILALFMVELLLPQFNQITSKKLSLIFDPTLALIVLGIVLVTGLLAGSYPALHLSGFSPAKILKGKSYSSAGENWIRKGLVVFQFTLSVILIASVLVVYKQVEFIQDKNLGYNKDNIAYFSMEGRAVKNHDTFLKGVRNIPGIVNASSIGQNIIDNTSSTSGVWWEGKNEDEIVRFYLITANYNLLETLDIKLKEGRTFSTKFSNENEKVIINEAAAELVGYNDPIGKPISLWGETKQIIGIAKNFHFTSLHNEIKPLMVRFDPDETNLVMAKIQAGTEQRTLNQLRDYYNSFNPGYPLEYSFLDQNFQSQYKAEQRVSVLSRYFAGIAIIISCLGLFGLAAFTAERRQKEIGIRKVLGADDIGIVYLLSGHFAKIVLTAIIIAIPISYIMAAKWLNGFAYHIELKPWYFISTSLIALAIAWLTVGIQAIKAATIKPVDSLRSE
ncbi:MAG: FtsX-like permease family protein [Balneolaceae bacterium]|nr:FtsX-like permease family protein [Balneolaceae bacterium]